MVEHQHGVSSFLSFGAKSVQPEILEKLLIGREKIAKTLEKKVKNIAKDGLNHQTIVVGARGTGKTHLLRILYHRAQPYIKKNKIVVAYFAEEEYGIADYLDFMVRILHAFIRWNDEDADFLNEQMTILQETPSSHQEETAEKIIKSYLDGRPLLILAENFNDILEDLKKKGQSKLRAWLYRNDRTSIIATAQALSDDIGREDRPFYGFFEEIHLQKLSFDESYELLKSLAKIEKRDDVLEHLNTKGLAQVKAIHRLVKGNHRLLVTFYEFLKADLLSDLSVTFIKTLNDLKPYYETYIRFLPPQQQKILRFIAMAKIPQLGKEIARQCFIDQKSLSKQLSELTKKKLIEAIVDVTDKRNKLYDIAEPLLRLSIEIGEHKEGVNALFIDFLALYYENNELEAQKNRFSEMLSKCVIDADLQKYHYEIQARERALEIQKNFISEPKNEYDNSFLDKVIDLGNKGNYQEAIEILESKESEHEKNWLFYLIWGSTLLSLTRKSMDRELAKVTIQKFEKVNKLNANNNNLIFIWAASILTLAKIKNNEKLYESAIQKLKYITNEVPNNLIYLFSLIISILNLRKLKKIDYLDLESLQLCLKYITLLERESEIDLDFVNRLILTMLISEKFLSIQHCEQIEKIILETLESPKELLISYKYIKTYRKVILQGEKQALYELPKEQREFFEQEILAKHK